MKMKICFVWVEKFRNFENFGINLSSDTKFKFDHINNQIIKEEITPLPYNFFGERITDVTGIIGKNGAGKSNVVEMICKSLKGGKSSLNCDFFLIIKEENTHKCYYNFKDKNKRIGADFILEFEEYISSIKSLNVVFFSNVFDEKRLNFDKEIADISVNNLQNKKTFYRRYTITDFEKQLDFINSDLFDFLGIELPSSVQVVSKVFRNSLNSSGSRNRYGKNEELINTFTSFFKKRIREIKDKNKFILSLRFGYFFEITNYAFKSSFYESNDLKILLNKLINDKLSTEVITEELLGFLKLIINNLSDNELNANISSFYNEIDGRSSTKESILQQIAYLRNQNFENIDIVYDFEGKRSLGLESFTIEFNKNSKDNIYSFVKYLGKLNIIDIKWLGISSGHKAYLNLFASINHELKNKRNNNLLLCIDEGDLYLHPKWQIEFFDRLVNTLPQIYSGNIQLILTSHSPFLLSDLPNQNLVILDKSQEGVILNGIELKNKTFSGNLYDLYREPFFLENQVSSEFAYKKLIEIIKDVENKNYKNKSEILNKVDIIGDDIIRHRLEKILRDD